MIEKKTLYFYISILFLAVFIIAAFNLLYKKKAVIQINDPSMSIRQRQDLSMQTPRQDTQEQAQLYEKTREVMVSLNQEERPKNIPAVKNVGNSVRNPFLWPGELETTIPPPPPPPEARESPRVPVLGVICVGGEYNVATLDNVLVSEGDRLGEHLVTSISKDQVVLSGKYGQMRLRPHDRLRAPVRVEMVPPTSTTSAE